MKRWFGCLLFLVGFALFGASLGHATDLVVDGTAAAEFSPAASTDVADVAVPTSVSAGAATGVGRYNGFTAYLYSMGTSTNQLQISPDCTNWQNEGTALTTAGNVHVSKYARCVRWNVTAYTNGTPLSKVVGLLKN